MPVHCIRGFFLYLKNIFGLFVLFYHKANYLKPPTSGTLKIFIYYLLFIVVIIIAVWCFGFLYLVRVLLTWCLLTV